MFRRFFEHICKHRKLDWNESTAIVAEMVSIPRPNDYVEPIHPVYADALNLIAHLKISDYNIWYPHAICIWYPVYPIYPIYALDIHPVYLDISNLIAHLKISEYNICYPYLMHLTSRIFRVYRVSCVSCVFRKSRIIYGVYSMYHVYPLYPEYVFDIHPPYANVLNLIAHLKISDCNIW